MKKPTSINNKKISFPGNFRAYQAKPLSACQKNIFLVIAGLTALAIIVSFTIVLSSEGESQPVITPLSKNLAQVSSQPSIQEAAYYINIAQKFLARAEELSQSKSQTPPDKEKILIAVQNSLETISEGINHYPKDDRLYAQRAKIYQGISSFSPNALEAAVNDLEQARKLSPQNPSYPKTQSQILAQMGKNQEASFYAKITYEIEPQNLQNLADLGQSQIRAGEISQAISSYKTLISLLPKDSQEITVFEKEILTLKKLIAQASQDFQLQPTSELTPKLENVPADIELLPKEQASLPQNLIIASSQEESKSSQSQEANLNAIAGEATIPAGENEITIYNSNLTGQDKINLAPEGDIDNQVLYIKSKVANPDSGSPYFVVALSKPLSSELTFKWWIIQ
jgi:Flp pilus assembly protein TadD